MKNLTRLLLVIHVVFVFVCMWGAPFIIYLGFEKCQMTKMTLLWLALMLGQFIHWKLLKHECILSLLEKKSEDPSYVMGSNPGKSHIWIFLNKLKKTKFVKGTAAKSSTSTKVQSQLNFLIVLPNLRRMPTPPPYF